MRRHQLVYILSGLVLGAIGFAIGMAFIPDEWSDRWNKKDHILKVFNFQTNFVDKGILKSGWNRPEDWGA